MDRPDHDCRRKEPRYRVRQDIVLGCETQLADEAPRGGMVIDVSTSGLRLLCDGTYEVGTEFEIELRTEQSYGVYRGVIRHVEPWNGGQSVLGCQLNEPISDEVLAQLAAEGIVDRRTDNRIPWDKPAAVSWQLHQGEEEVCIRDYSPGGMRVLSKTALPEGVALRLRIEAETEHSASLVVVANAVWREKIDEQYQAGLAFRDKDAPRQLAKFHQLAQQQQAEAGGSQPQIRNSIQLAAAAILLLVAALRWL